MGRNAVLVFDGAAEGRSFAIATARRAASSSREGMPVILDDEGEERWLAGELGELVAPFPAQLMTVARDPDQVVDTAEGG